ncbi:MAG: flagellar export chaperone FlgN [Planctomycetales bacterium]|nr:flagellar export chaperone FlgN [Planctomycetales bacterium]
MNLQSDMIENTADYCLAHLKREAELLESCRDALERVRCALRSSNGDELLEAIQTQALCEQRLSSAHVDRDRLVNRLAITLDVPARRATVALLLSRMTPGERQVQLLTARRRVKAAARQVEKLCRGNSALIRHRIDLMRRLLHALGASGDGTYQATGAMQASSRVPATMVERRC